VLRVSSEIARRAVEGGDRLPSRGRILEEQHSRAARGVAGRRDGLAS
jgi:hypothetical protein